MSFLPLSAFPGRSFPDLTFPGYSYIPSLDQIRIRPIAFPYGTFSSLTFPKYSLQNYSYTESPSRANLAEMIANKVTNNVGNSNCWSLYNDEYRYRQFLSDFSRIGSNFTNIIQTSEVSPQPDLDDYDNLTC